MRGEENGRKEKLMSANHRQALRDPSLSQSIYPSCGKVFSFVRKRKVSSALSQTPNLQGPQWEDREMSDRLLEEGNKRSPLALKEGMRITHFHHSTMVVSCHSFMFIV